MNSRDKAVLHFRDEAKFFLLVNAHEQRIEAVNLSWWCLQQQWEAERSA